jgi:PhnB protein
MQAMPYINFRGECREAIYLYTRAFGAEVKEVSLFEDIPQTPEGSVKVLEPRQQLILHAILKLGDGMVRVSDCMGKLNDRVSERLSIAIVCSPDEVQHAFSVLSEEGKVGIPLQKTFFSPCHCVVIDKYGVMWNIWAQDD